MVDDADGARASPRVEATFRVSFPNVDQLLVAYANDLSKGGMFLATEQFLPINAVVRVHLELGAGSADIPVISRVAYVRDREEAALAGKPAAWGSSSST